MDRRTLTTVMTAMLVAACSSSGNDATTLVVETDTIGDTIVVRTLAGSAWEGDKRLVPELSIGELDGDIEYLFGRINSLAVGPDGTIYVVDAQVPDLRAYSADGVFLRTLGSPGEGPGELKQPDGGLAVLSDGRVVVRDPGNARMQVYSAAGEALDTWPMRGGFFTSMPFHLTYADEVHEMVLVDPEADVRDWQIGLVRHGPNGEPGDTLLPPDTPYEAPMIEARTEGGSARNGVPFSAAELWDVHPEGYFVHAIATDYAVTLLKPDGAIRIEREYEPVPVTAGERSEEEERATRNMRRMVPDWRWNGPAIPDTKPPFREMHMGRDGRIWLLLYTDAVEVDDPEYDPTDPDAVPDRWHEPPAFDVFEPDGTYLGRVDADLSLRPYPTPVFDGDHVWAVEADDLGVQRVVRYRIEPVASGG